MDDEDLFDEVKELLVEMRATLFELTKRGYSITYKANHSQPHRLEITLTKDTVL